MKKSIISLLLAGILLFGATEGAVSAFVSTEVNKDIPAAQNTIDDYSNNKLSSTSSYNLDSIEQDIEYMTEIVKSKGGFVETNMPEELDAQSENADVYAVYDEENIEEIQQIITVMTTATGSKENDNYVPSKQISNAIVRINGIPRFTDRNGHIKVLLTKYDYVELFVEKDGYNPYIEIMEVTGEEKVIYLKQPSDDIDIFGANLTYDGESVNLLNQHYSIDKIEETYEENFIFELLCSVKIDKFELLQNEKVKFSSMDNNVDIEYISDRNKLLWKGKNFESFFEVGGNIELKVYYEGVSKTEKLLLKFMEIDSIDLGDIIDDSDNSDINVNIKDGFLDKINISFVHQLKDALKITPEIKKLCQNKYRKSTVSSGKLSFHFEIVHDNKAMTTKIMIGLDIQKDYTTKQNKQRILDSFKKSYNACKNLKNYNKLSALNQAFFCPGLTTKPCGIKSPGNFGMEASFCGTFVGYVEISDEQFETENLNNGIQSEFIEGAGIEVILGASFEWTKNCVAFIGPFPLPYYFKFGFELNFDFDFAWRFSEGVDFFIEMVIKLYGKVGAGLGVGQVCGINIYGKLEFEFKVYLTDTESKQFDVNLIAGLEGKLFCFSFDIPLIKVSGNLIKTGAYQTQNLASLMSYSAGHSLRIANELNIGSEPQIIKYGNKEIKVWIEDKTSSGDLNASKLYYSVKIGEQWSEKRTVSDDNFAECSPVLKCMGNKAYLTWVKSNIIYDSETTLGNVIESEELYVSEFNDLTNTFDKTQSLTNDNLFDAAPNFIKSNNGEVSLVWQKNTSNDIFGTSGKNQLFVSKLANEKWENPKCIFETDKPILNFDACIENSEILLSLILDEDCNLETIEDRCLYVKKGQGSIKKVVDSTVSYSQLHFIKNELQLLFLQDGKIKSCKFMSNNEIEEIVSLNSITNSFEVETFNDKYVISYLDPQTNGVTDLKVSILTESSENWSAPIVISYSRDVKDYALRFEDNKFRYVISEPKRDDSGELLYNLLCEDEYVLNYDIALEEVVILDTINLGKNAAYCFLVNCGSYPIDTVKLSVSGYEETILLNEQLQPSQSTIIEFDFVIEKLTEIYLDFSVFINQLESNLDNNTKKVYAGYSEVKMVVEEKIYKNQQSIKLNLYNEKCIEDNVRIVVHKNNLKGDIVYSSECFTIKDSYEYNLNIDYASMGIRPSEVLCIELQCSNEQIEEQSYIFNVMYEETVKLDSHYINLLKSIQTAKTLII